MFGGTFLWGEDVIPQKPVHPVGEKQPGPLRPGGDGTGKRYQIPPSKQWRPSKIRDKGAEGTASKAAKAAGSRPSSTSPKKAKVR